MTKLKTILYPALIAGVTLLLSGCKNLAILNPKGIIAEKEMHLLIDSTLLMLIVVIPVIILTFVIAWHYRASNKKAKYTPNDSHSTIIEVVCWSIPATIIFILAVMTWISSHRLDPYRPINNSKPLVIQAVALDWRWMFIYPKQHIATINYMQIPVHQQVRLMITADAPMNSLEIPQLAGQIYAMTGMQTKLHIMASQPGIYTGLSTNYSGDGFAGMEFKVKVGSHADFKAWVRQHQKAKQKLTMKRYNQLLMPTKDSSVHYFADPAPRLFNKIIMKYMMPTKNAVYPKIKDSGVATSVN